MRSLRSVRLPLLSVVVGVLALSACTTAEPETTTTITAEDTSEEPSVTEPSVTEPVATGTVEAEYDAECGRYFAEAAAKAAEGNREDSDLDEAIKVCGTLEAFSTASIDHPDALGDVDPEQFVSDRCVEAEDPEVAESEICLEDLP